MCPELAYGPLSLLAFMLGMAIIISVLANAERQERRDAHVSPSATNRDKGNRKEDGGSTPPVRAT